MAGTAVNKNTATAFITGALLGAGVALLFAPQSGRQTRRDIRHLAEKAKNKAEAAQLELRHSIENIVGDAADKIQEGLDRGMDWTDSKVAELQRVLESGRKFIRHEIDKIQSA